MLQHLLLGPQRPAANLAGAFERAGLPAGPVGVISAGWQEAEGEFDELAGLVPRPLLNIDLYQRAQTVFLNDPTLRLAYRERQDRLQSLQRLYRLRLRELMLVARRLKGVDEPPDLVAAEERHAVAQLRALDRHHLNRIESIYREFEPGFDSDSSEQLARQRREVVAMLDDCPTLLLTGGNVLVLLNRLQLFGLGETLASRHLVAWSAGAMVLAEQVVLFHDSRPNGRRDAELLGSGMAAIPGFVFLPDARRRLRERDSDRIGLFSSRFSPQRCVTLDNGAELVFESGRVVRSTAVDTLTPRGAVTPLAGS